MQDLAQSEMIVFGTLLEAWPEPMPKALSQLVTRAPAPFTDKRAGRLVALLRDLHLKGKPTHLPAIREAAFAKEIIGLADFAWFNIAATSGLILEQAELEAQTILERFNRDAFVNGCLELGQTVTEKPDQFHSCAKILIQMSEEILNSNGHSNGTTDLSTIDAILAYEEPPNLHLLENQYLTKHEFSALIGPPQVGKTRLALRLAIAQVINGKWCGLCTSGEPMKWLFFGTENSAYRWKNDLAHIWPTLTPDQQALVRANILIQIPHKPEDYITTLEDDHARAFIRESCDKHKPGATVFDALSDYAIGDPNKGPDMRETLAVLRNLVLSGSPECAMLPIHHAAGSKVKFSQATGLYEASNFGSNSRAFFQVCRFQMYAIPASNEDPNLIAILCGKSNNAQQFAPRAVCFNADTFEYEPYPDFDWVQWKDELDGKPEKERGATISLDALVDAVRSGARSAAQLQKRLNCAKATLFRRLNDALSDNLLERIGHSYILGSKNHETHTPP